MKISNHYLAYPKKTLIVVTNNELAKVFRAFDRDIDEVRLLEAMEIETPERGSGTPNAGPPRTDEIGKHLRQELYKRVNDALVEYLKSGDEEIILCAPEAHKNELTQQMHADVMRAVVEVVPKNLASLPLDAVVRILQETRM